MALPNENNCIQHISPATIKHDDNCYSESGVEKNLVSIGYFQTLIFEYIIEMYFYYSLWNATFKINLKRSETSTYP